MCHKQEIKESALVSQINLLGNFLSDSGEMGSLPQKMYQTMENVKSNHALVPMICVVHFVIIKTTKRK